MALGHSLLEEFIARSSVSYHNYYVIIARICCSAMFFVRSVCSVGWWGRGGRRRAIARARDDAFKKENSYRYYGFIFFTDVEM